MALPKIQGSQRDFSAGELDVSMKRADDNPIMKAGARQALNWRIRNSKSVVNRPGRSALFLATGRVEEVLMSPGNTFFLVFGNGSLKVFNAAGTQVFISAVKGDGATAIPWTTATLKLISYVVAPGAQRAIYVAYGDDAPANVPQVLTWDGVSQTSTWTLTTFAETISPGGQKRTPFYRISPQNITMQPSAAIGAVNVTLSVPLFVTAMVGTRFRYCGRQLQLTAVTAANFSTPAAGPSLYGTATVIEPLPPSQLMTVDGQVGTYNIGDELLGSITGAKGIITNSGAEQELFLSFITGTFAIGDAVVGGTSGATATVVAVLITTNLLVALSTGTAFTAAEVVTGPNGSGTAVSVTPGSLYVQILQNDAGTARGFVVNENAVGPSASANVLSVTNEAPQPVSVWDDEVMNLYRGYPTAVFYDQGRLGFNNFPSVPSGIGWSAFGLQFDFYVSASTPDGGMFELAPGKSRVLFVVPGAESSEFVFCDNAVYYIPITATNPLKSGSVAFNILSKDGSAAVQPVAVQDVIVWINAGLTSVLAIVAPGAYYRPYEVRNLTELHGHLIKSPIAIAAPSSTAQFEERYVYVLNNDGTLAVGKYAVENGQIKGVVGWLPWGGGGSTAWVSALGSDVIFSTFYVPNGIGAVYVIERLDNTQYLDGAQLYNTQPSGLPIPGGKGPLWWIAGGSVDLMDNGTRMMGTYIIDANGFLIPQNNGGEDFTSATLAVGQAWTAILEPFVPDASPGQSVGQRMFKRRVSRMAVYVIDSTGFLMARLFSGPLTRTSPALGTIMNTRRVTTWNQDDDPTQPPPLRETVERWRPIGRSFDPRVCVIKDTPGPLEIAEIGIEATV